MNYDLFRGLHIIAVIAWMAGLLYLPRLFAYHSEAPVGSERDEVFRVMERKLFKIIMNPAMIAAWIFGVCLIWIDGQGRGWAFIHSPWMITKLAGVVFLTFWHGYLGRSLKTFAAGKNTRPRRFWLMTNELPFVAAIIMVLAVTTEFLG